VKYDYVAKNDVIDLKKNDSKILRDRVLLEFKEQNSTNTIDYIVIKVA
jgi:hypothetical protein